jgi:hypothetical protein
MKKDDQLNTFTFEGSQGELVMEGTNPDENLWYTEKMDKVPIPKKDFILEAVKEEFPNLVFNTYKELLLVLSRSKALGQWYSLKSAEWVRVIELPTYLLEVVPPDVYQSLVGQITTYNTSLGNEGKAIKAEADIFQAKIKAISEKEQKIRDAITKNDLVKVITMGSDEMPISLQLEIERYTPVDGDGYQQRRKFSREILYCFQKALASGVLNKTIKDVTAFINELAVK